VPDSTTLDVEARYAELEAVADAKRKQKMRRQPFYLIAIVNLLVIGVAATAMVDLRRLRTPGGVALRWTQSAVFGDCDDYLSYSVAVDPEPRGRAELCKDLRSLTEPARRNNLQIGLALGGVRTSGDTANVTVTLTRKEIPTVLRLRLERRGGDWKVLRDNATCGSVGCA
jgi:hypothetical protein